jgi:hypothetical protein
VNWLDPEPSKESCDYEKYMEEFHKLEQEVDIFRGFYQPPTAEEHNRLREDIADQNGY